MRFIKEYFTPAGVGNRISIVIYSTHQFKHFDYCFSR